jgi:hypothetical protein
VDSVARWPAAERAELFQETAARRGVAPTIIEKDFWVSWTLRRLFAHPGRRPAMLFKGGTSLSKVYNAIERFSEDIDLSLDRHDLGFAGDRDPENASSKKARGKLLEELKAECTGYLSGDFMAQTVADFESIIGPRGAVWSLDIDREDAQTLLFSYPRSIDGIAAAYVRPVVRMEFGARSDFWPAAEADLQPYSAEEFPEVFTEPAARVRVLEAKRTFWEKATILHAEFHRIEPRASAPRLSRHYYDLAQLAMSPIRAEALRDLGLLETVAHHKDYFFPASWARYDTARPGTLRLAPGDDLRRLLDKDYRQMEEMFFAQQPPFTKVLDAIAELEAEVNSLA